MTELEQTLLAGLTELAMTTEEVLTWANEIATPVQIRNALQNLSLTGRINLVDKKWEAVS